MILETAPINVWKGRSDECRAVSALRTRRNGSVAMSVDNSAGYARRTHLAGKTKQLIRKGGKCSVPNEAGSIPQFLKG